MALFYEKNGKCMEVKNNMKVEPEDTVTLYRYKIEGPPSKRSSVADETWNRVIAESNALIIVDKNKAKLCSGEERLCAMNDVSHIIGLWYDIILQDYNGYFNDDKKKIKSFGTLYNQMNKNPRILSIVRDTVRKYGMTIQDVRILFSCKVSRNLIVHKQDLNQGETASTLYKQLRDSLDLLHKAPNQPRGFPESFEKCARRVYRRSQS